MTIKEAQELVDAWGDKHAIRHNELANMALLTEEIGERCEVVAAFLPILVRIGRIVACSGE